jgi:opacity protein-like surface antigen
LFQGLIKHVCKFGGTGFEHPVPFLRLKSKRFQMKILLATLLLSTSVYAADMQVLKRAPVIEDEALSGLYLRGDISSSSTINSGIAGLSLGRAFGMGGGIGYRASWMRGDITADYRFPSGSSRATSVTLMANGYADLGSWAGFTPYLGLGIGMTSLTGSNLHSSSGASYAAMTGVSYAINKNIDLDLGYRYLAGRLAAHELKLGIRYRLD